jgi:hypothetical protein
MCAAAVIAAGLRVGASRGIIMAVAKTRLSIILGPITWGRGRRDIGARAGISPGQLIKTLALSMEIILFTAAILIGCVLIATIFDKWPD